MKRAKRLPTAKILREFKAGNSVREITQVEWFDDIYMTWHERFERVEAVIRRAMILQSKASKP